MKVATSLRQRLHPQHCPRIASEARTTVQDEVTLRN